MEKLIKKDPSYYRIGFGSGNLIYFSHSIDVSESEFTDLSIRDVIFKIDELVEAYNKVELQTKEIEMLREQVSKLLTISEDQPTIILDPQGPLEV